jgi:transcriptional regulator with GAF, ATPase, and Fis domain
VEFWDPRAREMRLREYRPDPALYQSYEERGIRSELRMPIWLQGERVGYLFFFSRQANAFSEDDVDLARRVADHLALAIAHERLAAETRRLTQAQEQASAAVGASAPPPPASAPGEPSRAIPPEGVNLEAIERDLIEKTMAQAQNNKSVAAKLLGLPRGQLYSCLKRHGLDRGKG